MHTVTERSAERGHENQGLVEIMDDSNDGSGLYGGIGNLNFLKTKI